MATLKHQWQKRIHRRVQEMLHRQLLEPENTTQGATLKSSLEGDLLKISLLWECIAMQIRGKSVMIGLLLASIVTWALFLLL